MAVAKRPKQTAAAKLQSQLEKYESFFGELDSFITFIRDRREELALAVQREAICKAELEEAREHRKQLQDAVEGAKDSLYQLVAPGVTEFLPLIDRMEPADPERHGEHAAQWRVDPIAALRLSPTATRFLIDADIVAVGQLQDMVLAAPDSWWNKLEGMSDAVAAAVVDQLNDFIFKKEAGDDPQ